MLDWTFTPALLSMAMLFGSTPRATFTIDALAFTVPSASREFLPEVSTTAVATRDAAAGRDVAVKRVPFDQTTTLPPLPFVTASALIVALAADQRRRRIRFRTRPWKLPPMKTVPPPASPEALMVAVSPRQPDADILAENA